LSGIPRAAGNSDGASLPDSAQLSSFAIAGLAPRRTAYTNPYIGLAPALSWKMAVSRSVVAQPR
jgi:hypothetical protein